MDSEKGGPSFNREFFITIDADPSRVDKCDFGVALYFPSFIRCFDAGSNWCLDGDAFPVRIDGIRDFL